MEFYIDKNSSVPVANQIQEQIKLAVMAGVFRKGDTLPSIRDMEKQTGINRSQIHKAYLALRKSGLLVLTRGKGSIVAAATESPRAIDENCRKLSKKIISRVRQMGLSPTAFARYLGRHAQENERTSPLIFYVDIGEETAVQRAEEISRLWQVPVTGLAIQDLKSAAGRGSTRRKILVDHIKCDSVRSMLSRNKSDVIPIELRGSDNIEEICEKIPAKSSVMIIHLPQPAHKIQFILAGFRKGLEPRGVKIFSSAVKDMPNFREVVNNSQCDYFLVGPAVRSEVPPEMRQDPRIIQMQAYLDRESLEVARIKAGVII
jgi:GntR family transcriptional regulator